MRCTLLVSSPERNSAEHSCPVNHRPRMGTGTYEWHRAQLRDRKVSIFESALAGESGNQKCFGNVLEA